MKVLFDNGTPKPIARCLTFSAPTKIFDTSRTFRAGKSRWLCSAIRPNVQLRLDEIAKAVNAATPGSYSEVDIPYE